MEMTTPGSHVLAISIGPVQPLIAAARRTRDLWYGSSMLSELSASAAQMLASLKGVTLVLPHGAAEASELAATTNKLVALVDASQKPQDIAVAVKEAIGVAIRAAGQACLKELVTLRCGLPPQEAARFHDQLGQALEVYVSWARVGADKAGQPSQYLAAYRQAQTLLDARKRLRDFGPNVAAEPGLALSSLDGAAETVLPTGKAGDRLRARVGIDSTEHLDALGLIKRVLGRAQGFPAVARVALEPWIATWSDADCARVSALLERCEALDLATKSKRGLSPALKRLPWDAELLLKSRRAEETHRAAEHAGALDCSPDVVRCALQDLDKSLVGLALPHDDALYIAVLAADGDRMGEVLGHESQTEHSHRHLSERLGATALAASKLIEAHGGACIYSGGDDTLAFVPVGAAIQCARKLADAFASAMPPPTGTQPAGTLSVGLAFVHVLTPFATARALAFEAQKLAKEGLDGHHKGLRNALGVVVKPRSGGAVRLCGAWDEANADATQPGFDRRLLHWTQAFASKLLSAGTPYDLQRLVEDLPAQALAKETARLFDRRIDPKASEADRDALQAALTSATQPMPGDGTAKRCERLHRELYLARWLASHPQPIKQVDVDNEPSTQQVTA